MLDLKKIRRETPALEDHIFLNSAGSSLCPEIVRSTMIEYLDAEMKYGGYKVMMDRHDYFKDFYKETATLLNAEPHNIAFAHNATDAYTKALSSIQFVEGDVILTTDSDYVSNYMYFISLKERVGVEIVRIEELKNGLVDLTDLRLKLEHLSPKVVAITHIPTNTGLVQDVVAIGTMCKNFDTIYIVDACQSVGQMVVDVQSIKCDFLAATGRKFMRGPRGTGLLYASDRILNRGLSPMSVDGWGAKWTAPLTYEVDKTAIRFEHFEKPYPAFAGFTEAIRYINQQGIANIESRNKEISNNVRAQLNLIDGVEVLDRGDQKSNIITFIKEGVTMEAFNQAFQSAKILCGFSMRFSALIDFDKKGHEWAVRYSPHYFNTDEELHKAVEEIREV